MSLDDVMAVRDILRPSVNAELNRIYESAGDRRRLSFSSIRSVSTPKNEALSSVMRDALCIEAVNLYTHHLMEEEKAEFHSLSSLPLMPLEEHTKDATRARARALTIPAPSDQEMDEVFNGYDQSSVCNLCHSPGQPQGPNDQWIFDEEDILTPEAPAFPNAFYTVLAVNRTGVRYADGSIDPDVKQSRVAILHHYNYTALSARYDQIFQDGAQREVLIRKGTVLYTIYPESLYCTAIDVGFNLHAPNWLQIGPPGTEATRMPDEVIDGVTVEVWDRQEPETGFSHRLFWNRESNKPVLNYFEGGPFVRLFQYWIDYQVDEPEYPGIYDIPYYCPEPVVQDPNITTPTNPEIPRNGGSQNSASNEDSSDDLGAGGAAGIAVAAVAAVAVVGAIYVRHQSSKGNHARLLDPFTEVSTEQALQVIDGGSV
jgi:hypothetical protein